METRTTHTTATDVARTNSSATTVVVGTMTALLGGVTLAWIALIAVPSVIDHAELHAALVTACRRLLGM